MQRFAVSIMCLATVLLSLPAFANHGGNRGSRGGECYTRPYITVASNGDQITLAGQSFCDGSYFRIRVSNDYNGNDGWYVSNTGNSQWSLNSNGSFSHTVAKRYMTPGNLFQVIVYTASGYPKYYFTRQLPCRMEDVLVFFNNPFTWSTDVGFVTVMNCGQPGPGPVVPTLPQQYCTVNVVPSSFQVGVAVSCSLLGRDAYLSLVDRNTRVQLCSARFLTTGGAQVCSFARVPTQKIAYEYDIQSDGFSDHRAAIVYKDPSFDALPQGQYTGGTELAPQGQSKSRGQKRWDALISVRVSDADVDASEGQGLIPVELVNMTTGATVETKMANSGDEVRFNLYRAYVNPWVGKKHFEGTLNEGENKFFVRVRDAYNGSARPAELPAVTVRVND